MKIEAKQLFCLLLLSTTRLFANECPGKACDGIFLLLDTNTPLKLEKDFQDASCAGKTEYLLPDKTRVDCLTETHAIEYDFASKWAEAVGQSLYYAFQTNKKAGIVLIYKTPEDNKYYHRIMSVIHHNKLNIDVWVIRSH